MVTDKRVFPFAAIYLTVKGVFGQREAYRIIENAAAQGCDRIGIIGAEDDVLWDTCRYIRRMRGWHG